MAAASAFYSAQDAAWDFFTLIPTPIPGNCDSSKICVKPAGQRR
jgi:hypothetical protein